MLETVRDAVAGQFGAALDMLEGAIVVCPDELWLDAAREPPIWYLVYHTLFWLDLYLSGSVAGFAPPSPFNLDELDPRGLRPERPFSQAELTAYLAHGRAKCRRVLAAMTDTQGAERRSFGWGEVSALELHLYNLRHVQHGVAQVNQALRQATGDAPRWIARTDLLA